MWKRGTIVGLTALCAIATGCSSSDSDPEESTGDAPGGDPRTEELFVGECGSITEDQLTEITGIRGLASTSQNAVSCRWDSADTGSYAMFTWYRASPIDRERTVAGRIGREISTIEADGHPGFTARGNDTSCEAGVENGDGFLHWSVNYVFSVPSRDVCQVTEALAQATVENAR
ncbi:MAG: DUF3558 domain-containing protein [Rhodococcus sp. (in: high G+C Gram-positive bacteria)]